MTYTYCIEHEEKLTPYSGNFETKIEALQWKLNPEKGFWLTNQFKRDLVLCRAIPLERIHHYRYIKL